MRRAGLLFYQSDDQQVQRVVDIKQPFHETVDAGAFTALAVVHFYDRDRENDAHLKNTVDLINSEEVHDGVERNIEHQPERLLFQVAAVRAEGEDAESLGKVTRQMRRVMSGTALRGRRVLFAARSITSPHASGHMTLVWLSACP